MATTLLILTSPPASGKTFWIKDFSNNFGSSEILVISPLRALREECRRSWGDEILVMTPEEWRGNKVKKKVVIFDEAHLNFYWGDTFRPCLWETFYEVTLTCELVIFLTATLDHGMVEDMKLMDHFDEKIWIDCGNRCLKYVPSRYTKLPSKVFMLQMIAHGSRNRMPGSTLIFCAYRQEVVAVAEIIKKMNRSVLTCLGGEALLFSQTLQMDDPPEFIVATTVLGHGVNLPKVSRIFLMYEIGNKDFWIQMVARGGRKGEAYEVLALEKPYGIKWNPVNNYLRVLWITLKIKCREQLEQKWFLKD